MCQPNPPPIVCAGGGPQVQQQQQHSNQRRPAGVSWSPPAAPSHPTDLAAAVSTLAPRSVLSLITVRLLRVERGQAVAATSSVIWARAPAGCCGGLRAGGERASAGDAGAVGWGRRAMLEFRRTGSGHWGCWCGGGAPAGRKLRCEGGSRQVGCEGYAIRLVLRHLGGRAPTNRFLPCTDSSLVGPAAVSCSLKLAGTTCCRLGRQARR